MQNVDKFCPWCRNALADDVKWIWTNYYEGDVRVYCRGLVTGYYTPDNMGRHFIIGYMNNINGGDNSAKRDVDLYVSTNAPTEVSVRVTAPAFSGVNLDESFTVSGGGFPQQFCSCLSGALQYPIVRFSDEVEL